MSNHFMVPQFILRYINLPKPKSILSISAGMRAARNVTLSDVVDASQQERLRVMVWDSGQTEQLRVRQVMNAEVLEVSGKVNACLDYFKSMLNRDGIDGKGGTVHCSIHFGKDYPNAFWNGTELALGDGDGKIFKSFALSLDVIAHEMAHGIVQHTSNLVYQGQSGALNEHFADVFGTVCQMSILRSTADKYDWLIGNEIMRDGEALRSMRYPGTAYDNPILGKDMQPAHMKSLYTGVEDSGGVHINSGIMNRLFYLAAREISAHSAARIWYGALTTLTSKATFADAVAAFIKTAQRAGSAGSPQVIRWASKEVGVI